MILIKNKMAISKMEMAGKLLAEVFIEISSLIEVGLSTHELDLFVAKKLSSKGLRSEMKGYAGYRYVSCISVNDEVVHGVPSKSKILRQGDLVKVDVCASWKGYCADMARCFFIEPINQKAFDLVTVAQSSLDSGIAQAYAGNRLGDISAAIQYEIEKNGYGVVRDFAGHGIGKSMHEEPELLNYGKKGTGPLLQVGMAIAIEPMITIGSYAVYVDSDEWTVKTEDGSLAAHVEDTIVITEQGPQVLTRL